MASNSKSKLAIGFLSLTGMGALGLAWYTIANPNYALVREGDRLERELSRLEAGLSQGVSYETIYNNNGELTPETQLKIKTWGDETIATREKLATIQKNPKYRLKKDERQKELITEFLYAGFALPTAFAIWLAHTRK